MAQAYIEIGTLMQTAGLPVRLQFGEVGWWFQAGGSPPSMAFDDADTAAAAATALGRALATFAGPASDPSVNAYADANFLRARLAGYVAAVEATVLAALPGALFEVLWPLDVNDPATAPLCRYVNLPPAWETRSGSGFDTFLAEALSYSGVLYDLNKALVCAGYSFQALSWDMAHCRYLMEWFDPCSPWAMDYLNALGTGVPLIKAWAWDHLNLYGWPLPLPVWGRWSRRTAG
jgi:hypothetical protein